MLTPPIVLRTGIGGIAEPVSYTHLLDIAISHNKGTEVTDVIKEIYPLILIVIFLVSVVIAVIYSKHIAKPIVEISNIARRMEKLDMTWKCRIKSKDEIGVLAGSLNSMALKLDRTLKAVSYTHLDVYKRQGKGSCRAYL